mmetsp:Transcript_1038/g.1840  ORF Transcript_1038/g.1840 Transcript_1038/m.1840 type:complete len:393 (+) Transcript_1038:84-1262(+)
MAVESNGRLLQHIRGNPHLRNDSQRAGNAIARSQPWSDRAAERSNSLQALAVFLLAFNPGGHRLGFSAEVTNGNHAMSVLPQRPSFRTTEVSRSSRWIIMQAVRDAVDVSRSGFDGVVLPPRHASSRVDGYVTESQPELLMTDPSRILSHDGALAFPTDTVWGLGCFVTDKEKVKRTLRLKGSNRQSTSSVVMPSLSEMWGYCKGKEDYLVDQSVDEEGMHYLDEKGNQERLTLGTLVSSLLPGFYTFVLPLKTSEEVCASRKHILQTIESTVVGPDRTLGCRLLTHEQTQMVVERAGVPLLATSLNLHGEPPAVDMNGAKGVVDAMNDKEQGTGDKGDEQFNFLKMFVPGCDSSAVGESSTVVKYVGNGTLEVLRQGSGDLKPLLKYIRKR